MRKTISNSYEAKIYSGETDIPHADLKHIDIIEYNLFNDYLGLEFYQDLLAGLEDYSAIEPWDSKPYTKDQKVRYQGIIYVATKDTTLEPEISEDWTFANKWKQEKDCFNKLWCEGKLNELIAYSVIKSNLPGLRTPIKATGLVYHRKEDFVKASKNEYEDRIVQQDSFLSTLRSMVHNWIIDNENMDCFKNYKRLKTENLGPCCTEEKEEELSDFAVF